MSEIPNTGLTWAILLARWTELAKAGLALPPGAEGEAWRGSIPSIIGLQAVTHALAELPRLPPDERCLGRDLAEVQIDRETRALRAAWPEGPLPRALREIIGDAVLALAAAGVEPPLLPEAADTAPTVLLLGLRGSGKTTVGRVLSRRLGRPFLDLDEMTPRLLGHTSVADAWCSAGEPSFREAEAEALARSLGATGLIIALGGGTPTAPGAAELIGAARASESARTVYLLCDAATLRARLRAGAGPNRPSLTGADPLAEIEEVLAQRDAMYQRLADLILEEPMSAEETAEKIDVWLSGPPW